VTVAETKKDLEDSLSLCAYHNGSVNQYYTLLECGTPMTGRYVQIQLLTETALQVYEVEVHGF